MSTGMFEVPHYERYKESKSILSYVEWLEKELDKERMRCGTLDTELSDMREYAGELEGLLGAYPSIARG